MVHKNRTFFFRAFERLLALSCGLALAGCIEEIPLKTLDQTAANLVIEGRISSELREHEIRLTRSADFAAFEEPAPIQNATVTIEGGGEIYDLREVNPGIYRTDSLAGVPGEEYRLTVLIEGQAYRASDRMPTIPSPFDPVVFGRRNDFLDFEFRRHQFGFLEPNLWEIHLSRDSVPFDLTRIDPSELGKQVGVEVSEDYNYVFTYYTHPSIEVNGLLNFDIPHSYGFNSGFEITQKKFGISEPYYQFLRSIFMETEWRGTIFPSIPANVQGNVEGAFGYFSAVSVASLSFRPG